MLSKKEFIGSVASYPYLNYNDYIKLYKENRSVQDSTNEIETTPQGGRHSRINGFYHLLPPRAIEIVSGILQEGAEKYEKDENGQTLDLPDSTDANWRKISTHSHINHALRHIFKHLQGDTTEDNIGHAACRLLFALEIKGK